MTIVAAPDFRLRDDRVALVLILLAGLLVRLAWLIWAHGGIAVALDAAEASNAALSVARTGVLGDAYFPGQGPTAHLMPVSPLIAGTILRVLGPSSAAAHLALLVWSLAQTSFCYLMLVLLFGRLGLPRVALRGGLAFLCLVPPFVSQEVVDFRYWESGLGAGLALASLTLLARIAPAGRIEGADLVKAPALVAAAIFVAPPIGLAAGLCWAVVALRCFPAGTIARLLGVGALCLALPLLPWVARNERVLGERVWLRSNAGLELALANHPAAVGAADPIAVFGARLGALHPSVNPALRPVIRERGGEVRYARALGRRTLAWMQAHPADAVRLYAGHLRDLVFPAPSQFNLSGWLGFRRTRAAIVALVSLLGLIGLVLGGRRFALPALYVAGLALPYGLFQPTARYGYALYGVMVFLAAGAAVLVAWRLRTRRRPEASL